MGKQTAYLRGKADQKERILKYLKHRKEGVSKMLVKKFIETGEINPTILEVVFTYRATISDIKKDRLDV